MAKRNTKADANLLVGIFVFLIEILYLIWSCIKEDPKKTTIFWKVLGGIIVFLALLGCIAQSPTYKKTSYKPTSTSNSYSYSSNYSSYSGTSTSRTTGNYKKALTKEEANALKGTGYHGTRPNSVAELNELRAAQVKCKQCGYHSDNGGNSLCDSCQARKYGK